jgi:GntR family histidine utilization transcriptional repressor
MSQNSETALPPFRLVERELTRRILAREYLPGDKLPSEATLVGTLGVSRQTVSKAISELAKQGLVTRNRRAGTTVASGFHERFVLPLFDVSVDVARRGDIYRYELLNQRSRRSGESGFRWSDVDDGQELLEVEIVHFASGTPVVHELRYIVVAAAPDVTSQSFEHTPPSQWLLDNVPWSTVRHRISAISCTASLASLLALAPGTACTVLERRTWHLEMPVTLARLTLAGERFEIAGDYTLPTL